MPTNLHFILYKRKMPFRRRPRRYFRRRRTYRRRAPYRRRRTRVPRNSLKVTSGYSKFYQKFSYTEPIPAQPLSAGSFTAWDQKFSLADIPVANLTAIQRLYRFWRIAQVRITFAPSYIGYDIASSVPTGEQNALALIAGNMMTAIEYDSNQMTPTTPVWPNEDAANEHSNLRKRWLAPQTGGRTTHVVKFRPKANNGIRSLASSTTASYTMYPISPWVSTASPSTELYGLKMAYQVLNSHPAFDMQIKCQYLIEVRGVK